MGSNPRVADSTEVLQRSVAVVGSLDPMRVLRGCVSIYPHDLVYRAFMMDPEQARHQKVRIAAVWSKGK